MVQHEVLRPSSVSHLVSFAYTGSRATSTYIVYDQDTTHELGDWKIVSTYAGNFPIIMLNMKHINLVGSGLKNT